MDSSNIREILSGFLLLGALALIIVRFATPRLLKPWQQLVSFSALLLGITMVGEIDPYADITSRLAYATCGFVAFYLLKRAWERRV